MQELTKRITTYISAETAARVEAVRLAYHMSEAGAARYLIELGLEAEGE